MDDTNFKKRYVEADMDGERLGITLWDSQGLDQEIADLQLRKIVRYMESKFEETLNEETKVIRSPGHLESHIHCVFLLLDPAKLDANIHATSSKIESQGPKNDLTLAKEAKGGALDESDLLVLETISQRTTVIPIISKADTVTASHMTYLKEAVMESLKRASIDPLAQLMDERGEDDEAERGGGSEGENAEEGERTKIQDGGYTRRDVDKVAENPHMKSPRSPSPSPTATSQTSVLSERTFATSILPMSVLSPSPETLHPEFGGIVGRDFPWGFADPYNASHCDFSKVKELVFGDWRSDLRTVCQEVWYERWRTLQLDGRSPSF